MAINLHMVLLPYHLVFDILSRLPVKSVCHFRCVSKGWRDLIASRVFAAAHTSRHGPLLVDTGSFKVEEPDNGHDMRLLDMDGNVVRVIKGAGGYGMLCSTSLDDLICVNGASCGGVNVVDSATGETLVFTLGDGRGWRLAQPSPADISYKQGSPVVIDGVMYIFQDRGFEVDDSLLSFDLESEQWRPDMIEGPGRALGEQMWSGTKAARLTELNGALCMVHSVFGEIYSPVDNQPDPFINIWILDSKRNFWIKAYTITMAPNACRYGTEGHG
ncbi:unnamed protein product [Alopecurus aequalis]